MPIGEEKTFAKFEAAPEAPGVKARFEGTLHELLDQDRAFAAELEKLLEPHKPGLKQEAHATNSQVSQISGNGNQVKIG